MTLKKNTRKNGVKYMLFLFDLDLDPGTMILIMS